MRLIDAESLSSMRFTHEMHDSEGRLYVPFDEVAEAIFNAPTIEAEPVKHGRWTKIGHIENTWLVSKCSECSYQTIDAGNYCTNCGAKTGPISASPENGQEVGA